MEQGAVATEWSLPQGVQIPREANLYKNGNLKYRVVNRRSKSLRVVLSTKFLKAQAMHELTKANGNNRT